MKTIKWSTRILALVILVFALPFYFGYGNPLPFINSSYSLWENIALTMVPIIFIGLALGWKYPRLAAYLIIFPISIGFILGLITKSNMGINLAVPLLPGILYLVDRKKIIKTVGVLLIKDDKALLVEHNESAGHLNGKYGLPAGRIELKEGIKEAAQRELKEETNLDVSLNDLILLKKKWTAKIKRKDGDKEFSLRVFYSNNFSGDLKNNEETSPKWIDINEIEKLDLLPNVFAIIKFYQNLKK